MKHADTIEVLHERGILAAGAPGFLGSIAGYQIERVLGRGGMGVVLSATAPGSRQRVAIKLLPPHLAVDDRYLMRLFREAEAASTFDCKHVVKLLKLDTHRDTTFLVIEYVDGFSLAEWLKKNGPLPAATVRSVIRQLLTALEAAHAAGVIHRDVKPSNILMSQPANRGDVESAASDAGWHVQLTDFGLARFVDAETRVTSPGVAVGTPEYMSPEMVNGAAELTPASDLFSAGVVLYEMLTGVSPFRAPTAAAVLHAIVHVTTPTAQERNPSCDSRLSALAERLMQKSPADRPGNATFAKSLLESKLTRWARVARWRRRISRQTAVAFTVFGSVATGAAFHFTRNQMPIVAVRQVEGAPALLEVRREGRTAWEYFAKLPPALRSPGQTCIVVDRNGDGRGDLVVAGGPPKDANNSECVFAYDVNGWEKWRLSLTPQTAMQWPGCAADAESTWSVNSDVAPLASDLDGAAGDELLLSGNAADYASRLFLIDPRKGEIRQTFSHLGMIQQILPIPPVGNDERPTILLRAINNKLDGWTDTPRPGEPGPRLTRFAKVSSLVWLDPLDMTGLGPPARDYCKAYDRDSAIGKIPPANILAYGFLDRPVDQTKYYRSDSDPEARSPVIGEAMWIRDIDTSNCQSGEFRAHIEAVVKERDSRPADLPRGWLTIELATFECKSSTWADEAATFITCGAGQGWRPLIVGGRYLP